MFTDKFSKDFIYVGGSSVRNNYIMVSEDLSEYGLDLLSCISHFSLLRNLCEFFKVSGEEFISLIGSCGYMMRDIFDFFYSTEVMSDAKEMILVNDDAYVYRYWSKDERRLIDKKLYIYIRVVDFQCSNLLLSLFRYRFGMIYENFVHTEKRFPCKFVIDERKKLGDISFEVGRKAFDNCRKVCYDLTVRDLVDIMTKGDVVYDELIEKSDFKFYTFNGLDDLFFLELCEGSCLYIPFRFLLDGDWDIVKNLKRYECGREYIQCEMEFFSSEKVEKFKNVCSLYFNSFSDKK